MIPGVIAMLYGMLDPLNHAWISAAGCLLITLGVFISHNKYRKIFALALFFILFGVFFIEYFSMPDTYVGSGGMPWWQVLFILPYGLGWIAFVVLLIVSMCERHRPLSTIYSPFENGAENGKAV